jgi:nucleoside-diphosphate-sugar epimerase
MTSKFGGSPRLHIPLVHIRDVVLAHFNALMIPEAKNQRFILVDKSLWFNDIAKILDDKFGQ